MAFVVRHRWPSLLLAAVCVLHALSSLALVGIHHGLGWDETVYLSQINRFVPAGIWSAPRSRGLTLLVAPVTLVTPSLAATRLWLALLSSVLMYAGFRPWLRLVTPYAVPLAALLFGALWTTVFYGAQAMPNLFVACFAMPAVALTLLFLREPERWWRLAVAAVCVAMVALLRPSDGIYVAVPLAALALAARSSDRRARLVAAAGLGVGVVAGAIEWVIEAYASFGGPLHRYHLAVAEQGGSGLQFSLLAHARALAGPILCRGACHPHPPWYAVAWWPVTAILVAAGIAMARKGTRLPVVAAVVTGVVIGAQYIFTVGYAAPRFLMPAYALLLVAAAVALVELVARAGTAGPRRGAVAGVVALLVAAHVVSQVVVLRRDVLPGNNRSLVVYAAEAAALRHHVVHHRPCALAGPSTPPVAYDVRCRSVGDAELRTGIFGPDVVRIYLSRRRLATPWLSTWTPIRLTLAHGHGRVWAYVAPGPVPSG
jgi:hypothetical protein